MTEEDWYVKSKRCRCDRIHCVTKDFEAVVSGNCHTVKKRSYISGYEDFHLSYGFIAHKQNSKQ